VDPYSYWNSSGEIFVDPYWNSSRHDWIINDKDSGSETKVTVTDGDRPLTYHRQCIWDCAEVVVPYFSTFGGIGGLVQAGGIIYGVHDESNHFPTPLFVGVCSSTQACNPGSSLWRMDIETRGGDWFYVNSFTPRFLHYPKLERNAQPFEWYQNIATLWNGDHFVRMFCLEDYGQNFDDGCTTMDEPDLYGIPADAIKVNGRTMEDVIVCWEPKMKYRFFCKKVAKSWQRFIPIDSAGCESRRPIYIGLPSAAVVILLIAGVCYYSRKHLNSTNNATTTAGGTSNGTTTVGRSNGTTTTTGQVVAIPIFMDFSSVPIIETSSPQEHENPNGTHGQTTTDEEEEAANGATTTSPAPQQVEPDVEAFA